jgi:hypothetical protein
MSNIINLNPTEYGLEANEAKQVQAVFVPMIEKLTELEDEYNQVVAQEMTPELTKQAKELRLKFVKIRTETARIHKSAKAYYLAGGRFVDGWKNAQLQASGQKEEKLKEIEDYYENLERQRREDLHQSRIEMISPYVEDKTGLDFRTMEEDVFQAYLSTKKQAHEDRIKAEAEAEQERIAKEKADEEAREQQRLENEKLRAEAREREREIEAQRKAHEAQLAKEREERRQAEQKLAEKARQEQMEKDKKEQERIEKIRVSRNKKYRDFLVNNGVTKEMIGSGEVYIEKNGATRTIYKKLATITIE